MITASQTNAVFYSAHSYRDFKVEVEQIRIILEKHNIHFVPLDGTEDYFCRDYMPVQKDEHTLVQFAFKPDYLLNDPKNKAYVSNPEVIRKKNQFLRRFNVLKSDIILDGGNVVHHDNTIIVTDKILKDNPGYSFESIKKEIGDLLGVNVIFIPAYPEEETGHVDGILRFISENTVLAICLEDEDEQWKSLLLETLSKEGIQVISLPLFPEDRDNQWAYVNFLQVGKIIILPELNKENNPKVKDFFEKLFPDYHIYFVDFNRIIEFGGAVNCFTWNIKGSFTNQELLITEHNFITKYPIQAHHKKLILGTIHPHNVSCFRTDFFYGNENSLWNILHDVFPSLLKYPSNKGSIEEFLTITGTAISDTVVKCQRLSDSASDHDFIPVQLNHELIEDIRNSNIDEIFFTSGFDKNNAFKLFYEDILKLKITPQIKQDRELILPEEVFGRPVKLTILYSPSGAANRALVNTPLFKMNAEKYNQFPDPVKQFKVDYYREKFRYVNPLLTLSEP